MKRKRPIYKSNTIQWKISWMTTKKRFVKLKLFQTDFNKFDLFYRPKCCLKKTVNLVRASHPKVFWCYFVKIQCTHPMKMVAHQVKMLLTINPVRRCIRSLKQSYSNFGMVFSVKEIVTFFVGNPRMGFPN